MQELTNFYAKNLELYHLEYQGIKKKLRVLAVLRFVLFTGTGFLMYLFWDKPLWVPITAVIGIGVFLLLVRIYENAKREGAIKKALTEINETELKVLHHQFEHLPSGEEFLEANHEYSHDLDLFGKGSFFQYINRTKLPEAKIALARLLTDNAIDAIGAKQEAIDELAQLPAWRQKFAAEASLVEQEITVDEVVTWLKNYKAFVPKFFRSIPWLFLAVTLILSLGVFMLNWPGQFLLYWMMLGLGISGRFYKKIMHLTQHADKVKTTFKQHANLLQFIEETTFISPQLRFQKQRLQVGEHLASKTIASFSSLLNTMDYNNNVFYLIFGNGFFLGALLTAFKIETWINTHGEQVADWFKVIAFFEAYNSLGNFSFNHPLYTYPVLVDGPSVLTCKELGHPLIPEEKNVRNDFDIEDEQFFIITGSNMAGKSTFLRSVGLSMVMANLGLPVCAEECIYSPRKLVTSMRSVDSLYEGDSYFFSELKRLKKVLQQAEEEACFVLLDEILKGTNSHDKAEGSKKFLARLVRASTTGIIATHDLSLCKTSEEYNNVFNYHLDATIVNNELSFDYKLKSGVSQTMNASFLLKKMDLI